MTTRTTALGAVALLLLVACGSTDNAEPAVTPSTTAPTTTTLTSSPSVPPKTTPAPEPTVPEPPSTQMNYDAMLGAPAPHLLEALPSDEIPWDSVGPGWLAFAYPNGVYSEDAALDQRGLYLVDPDDRIYAVSALPADGNDLVSASWTGHVALLRGPYADGLPLGVLDLETTGFRTVVPDSENLEIVSLTRDGTGLWVYDLPSSNPPQPGESIRVSLVRIADGSWTTIYEEPATVDNLSGSYSWWINKRGSMAEMADGDIAFGTPDGLKIGPADGSTFRMLESPGDVCSIVNAWDDETIQVRCAIPDLPIECDWWSRWPVAGSDRWLDQPDPRDPRGRQLHELRQRNTARRRSGDLGGIRIGRVQQWRAA